MGERRLANAVLFSNVGLTMNSPFFIFFFQGQDLAEITGVAQIQEAADALAAAGLVRTGGP
jgi:hypothetical protein